MRKDFHSLVDHRLSGLEWKPEDSNTVLHQIKGEKIMKKKISLGFALAFALMLMAFAAVALTVAELVKSNMQPVVQMQKEGILEKWDLNAKMQFIGAMKDFGIQIDAEKLAQLESGQGTDEEREQLAGQLIDAQYGERMRSQLDPTIDQPEAYPLPSMYTIYEDLWLRQDPTATQDEVRAAYDMWYDQVAKEMDRPTEPPIIGQATEEQIAARVDSYLSEVASLSRAERAKCIITATYHEEHDVWIAELNVNAADLREASKEYFANLLGGVQDVYTYNLIYTSNGEPTWTTSLDQYIFENLIPADAYIFDKDNVSGDHLKSFLNASVEEKAAFSAKWKPVVDAWLADHPEYEALRDQTPIWCTRHVYGIPAENAITQERAFEIAKNLYLEKIESATEEMISERGIVRYFYDITNAEHPLWKVSITANPEAWLPDDHKDGYFVIIDALTGEVIDAYTYAGSAEDFADKFM